MAWRGLGATLSSQFDVTRGPIITLALEALVKPYGIVQPREFLRAIGPELVTARLTRESERKVLVVEAFDRETLLTQARRYLGPRTKSERVGPADVFVSADPGLGAAALVAGHLILGATEDVRRCTTAIAQNRTLRTSDQYDLLQSGLFAEPAFARTLSDDGESVTHILALLTSRGTGGSAQFAGAEASARYSHSETRLTPEGFEKKTRSAFGLFGELISRVSQRN